MIGRTAALLLACMASPALAAGIDGQWRGVIDGTDTLLTLRDDGGNVSGVYAEGALQLQVRGTFAGERLQAIVREPSSGIDIAQIDARLGAAGLDAQVDAHNPVTDERRSARSVFARVGAAAGDAAGSANAAAPGTLDRSLIGTWVHEKMINSGGSNFASFSTVMTMQLGADGRVSQWSRSVGGGGDWSYDSGAGELQYSGRWSSQDGVLLVQLDGQAGFQPAARYRFSDAYLVTENDQGKLIWQRR